MKNATSLPIAMKRRTARPSNQRGITTVQVAIGILVSIIALVGSFGGFQYVAQAKVNTDVNYLADLKTATVRYGSSLGAGGFTATNATLSQLNNLGFFNSTGMFVTAGTPPTVQHQYQGAVTVAVAAIDDIDLGSEGLNFTFADLPATACRDIALRIDNLAHSIKATPAKTGGTASVVKTKGGTLDPVAAATGCAGTGNVNQLIVTLSRS
jgi:hypothetical protein